MWKAIVLGAMSLPLCCCCSSTATFVSREPRAGGLQLHGAYVPSFSTARTLIAEYCGGRASVEEQGDTLRFRCKDYPRQLAQQTR